MLKNLALALALIAVPTLARAETLGAEKVDDHKKDDKKDDHKDDHKKDDKKDDHKKDDHKDDHHDDAHKAKPKH
jgi:hypothetical protein